MKFEEALPLMRDFKKIGKWYGGRFCFQDGTFIRLPSGSNTTGSIASFSNAAFAGEWEIEEKEEEQVKVWDWAIFGNGEYRFFCLGMTEEEVKDECFPPFANGIRKIEGTERLEKASLHVAYTQMGS